jgi:hypothetical protein
VVPAGLSENTLDSIGGKLLLRCWLVADLLDQSKGEVAPTSVVNATSGIIREHQALKDRRHFAASF